MLPVLVSWWWGSPQWHNDYSKERHITLWIHIHICCWFQKSLPTELTSEDGNITSVTSVINRDAYYEHIQSHPQDSDITILNIQENMNEGKSQTWFHYASLIMEQYDFDYAVKADTDSYILTDLFFDFAYQYLPIRGNRTCSGMLVDKSFLGGANSVRQEWTSHS